MRYTKFRIWDMQAKILRYSITALHTDAYVHSVTWISPLGDEFTIEDFELMQYIGLKDKHGVKIYDGDIIYDGIDTMVIAWDPLECRYIMCVYDEGYILDYNDWYGIEVIGNKHENPELMEEVNR